MSKGGLPAALWRASAKQRIVLDGHPGTKHNRRLQRGLAIRRYARTHFLNCHHRRGMRGGPLALVLVTWLSHSEVSQIQGPFQIY